MRSNCLLFALALHRRRQGRHRYLLLRRSRFGLFPHVLYAEARPYGLRVIHMVPTDPRWKAIPPPLFRGFIRWGD